MLQGEQDIFGQPFNSAAMAALEAAGSSWSGGHVERLELEWFELEWFELVGQLVERVLVVG